MAAIEIIRINHIYNVINPCVLEREVKLTMFVPSDVPFYIYPLEDYLPDLEVRTHDGRLLSLLPYQTLDIDINVIRRFVSSTYGISEEKLYDYENFAIIQLPEHDDYYEQLSISWIESIEPNRSNVFPLTLGVPLTISFPSGEPSLYVDIRINEKYELEGSPTVAKIEAEQFGIQETWKVERPIYLTEPLDYRRILRDKRHYVFRFGRNLFQTNRIQFNVTIPKMVRIWSGLGLAIGFTFVISMLLYANPSNVQSFATLAGVTIAGLIALRIVLFHDVELLKWLHLVYIMLILLIIGVIIYLMATLPMRISHM